ncbi:mechanosensitive ion channel [Fundicoccus culcitae]|uniref:Mechanosensitive ion channel n=1 Tax=Fundicoccus culcitae TaxID=2969821 RepID=A0ABY5P2D9_9LACT|nr:mechanosensitive ion channel [Fundicoccus culcitae]UUX32874.1 mechanosensitive ion channel [Fundicoccus culcitae]
MDFEDLFSTIIAALPGILGALLLLILALIISQILKRLTIKGLNKIDFGQKLQNWGVSKNDDESDTFLETIGTFVYFIVMLFFLPFILNGLNLSGVADPIINMFNRFFEYIPNIIAALIILVVGLYFCRFVKNLVQNLFEGLNIDKWYAKVTGRVIETEIDETRLAEVLANIVYVLIFIPILTVALETLGIESISTPIIGVLNQILAAIPNILTALVLVIIGGFISNLLADLIESLLRTSGIDRYSNYLNFKGETHLKISTVTAQIIKMVLLIFFIVEALNVLRLEVLNTIGTAVIAYMPLVISAIIILAIGIIGGNILADFLAKVSGSKVFGEFARYAIIVLSVFMTLDQLQFAQTIVNSSFIIILGSIALTFVLAFGLGGREFAAKQLEKADKALDEDISHKVNEVEEIKEEN